MNWQTASTEQIVAKLQGCIDRGTGVTISPRVVLRLIRERQLLARLAADEPQFSNPLHVYEAQRLRDEVLAEGTVSE
jgi:hypothetical protein